MPEPSNQSGFPAGESASVEIATLEVLAPAAGPAPSAARTTRAPRTAKSPSTTRPRAPAKKKPGAAEKAALETMRKELAAARAELVEARREVGEALAACREAESRLAATRADADAIRRTLSEVDSAAAEARGIAESARAEVDRSRQAADETEQRLGKLHQWLAEARQDFAALDAESRQALEDFRTAVDELRAVGSGEVTPLASGEPAPVAATLPDVTPLSPEERAEDFPERFIHLLNDAWAAEKEQVGLLQTLADECEDAGVRAMLEEDRAACHRRQEEVEKRLESLGARPTGGRGLLGQLVTRVWDAVQSPRDASDKVVLALLKAVSAAEFQAGLFAAAHAFARFAGSEETAQQLAEYFRQERVRADRLRGTLAPTVSRAAHR